MSRLIVFLSRPRTGTNYLVSLLRRTGTLASKAEVFHRKRPYGLSDRELSKLFGADILQCSARVRADAVHQDPKRVIDLFRRKSNHENRPVSFKVFPGHLPEDVVDELLLADESIAKVIVDREILPTYISTLKARKVDQWARLDTSDIKVTVDRDQFEAWYHAMRDWYQFLRDRLAAHGARYGYLSYSEWTVGSENQRLEQVARAITAAGLDHSFSSLETQAGSHRKQDRGKALSESVENWAECGQHPLFRYLQSAEGNVMTFWNLTGNQAGTSDTREAS